MTTSFATLRHALFALLLGTLLTPPALGQRDEKLPPGRRVAALEALPKAIHLKNRFDYSQLLLTGVLDDGSRVDVTRLAKLEYPAKLVKVSATGLVRPLADGTGEIRATVEGKTISLPLQVSGQKAKHEVSFVREVMPVLSRIGCNAGTCHGSAKGKNGFALSLRGYDPIHDHRALTDDVWGRRFNRAAAERSLMLMKPSGDVPHVGGVLIHHGDPYYELLRTWIAQGVKLDRDSPRVAKIDIYPPNPTIPLPGMKQQMVVYATYTDGTVRDVSAEAFIETSNKEVADVDKQGLVTAERRGETAMLARYEGNYAAAPLIVMGDRSGFVWQPVPEYNWIDTLVYEKLKQVKVQPSDVCTDAEFLRRLYLDLTGLPPTPEEARAFLADMRPSKEKREALVDKLVGSPAYVEHWTNKWADLLQVNSNFLGMQGAQAYRDFIKKAIASNMPYDQFARAILTAKGSNLDNPAASYWKILRETNEAMENTTHLFLAIRFNCNKCHDHPFERWTQDNYYHLEAFFAQVQRREDPRFKGQKIGGTDVRPPVPLVEIVDDAPSGEVKHYRTGQIATPQFPFTHADMPSPKLSRRQQLAHWITSKDNPYFARSYVNRVWSYLLGVGLIEPVDDIRAGNPPTNPKLLDRLTKEFVDSGFDVQKLVRTICKSRTYQHSLLPNRWNKDDDVNYSHALARRLPAEVLYDTIHQVLGSTSHLPGLPPGARAAQLVDPKAKVPGGFLDLLGRPPRESACECERNNSMLLGPVLALINGPEVGDAVKDPNNRLAQLVARYKDDAKVVEEIYLAMLARYPTKRELALGIEAIRGAGPIQAQMQAEYAKLKSILDSYQEQLDAKQPAWEAALKHQPTWTILQPESFKSAGGATLTKQADNSILASGKNPTPETYTVTAKTPLSGITAIRLEVLPDKSLKANGPGRASNGNFVLNEFKVAVQVPVERTKALSTLGASIAGLPGLPLAQSQFFAASALLNESPKALKLTRVLADFSQSGFEVQKAIDNNLGTGWAIAPQFGRPHVALFELKDKLVVPAGAILTFTLEQKFAGKEHNIGRFRLSVTTTPPPLSLGNLPADLAKALYTDPAKRTPQQKALLRDRHRAEDKRLAELQRQVADHAVPADPRLVGAQDLAAAILNSREFLFNH
jgi:hypothetical protein